MLTLSTIPPATTEKTQHIQAETINLLLSQSPLSTPIDSTVHIFPILANESNPTDNAIPLQIPIQPTTENFR